MSLGDKAEDAAIFLESGMGAISSMLMEFLNPGDVLLHSVPVYGWNRSLYQPCIAEMGNPINRSEPLSG